MSTPNLAIGQFVWMDIHGLGPECPDEWRRHQITGETAKFYEIANGRKLRIRKSDLTLSVVGDGERGQVLTEAEFAEMVSERQASSAEGSAWIQ